MATLQINRQNIEDLQPYSPPLAQDGRRYILDKPRKGVAIPHHPGLPVRSAVINHFYGNKTVTSLASRFFSPGVGVMRAGTRLVPTTGDSSFRLDNQNPPIQGGTVHRIAYQAPIPGMSRTREGDGKSRTYAQVHVSSNSEDLFRHRYKKYIINALQRSLEDGHIYTVLVTRVEEPPPPTVDPTRRRKKGTGIAETAVVAAAAAVAAAEAASAAVAAAEAAAAAGVKAAAGAGGAVAGAGLAGLAVFTGMVGGFHALGDGLGVEFGDPMCPETPEERGADHMSDSMGS